MSDNDEPTEDTSVLDRFMAENGMDNGGFEVPEAGASCSPSHTVHCVPGTCTKTEIIILFE